MTNLPLSPSAHSPSTHIRLPGIATGLFATAPMLLLIGVLTALGTSSRDYFERAPTQTTVGTVMILVAIAMLLCGFVLVGMRAIAQQQVDILQRAERAGAAQPNGD